MSGESSIARLISPPGMPALVKPSGVTANCATMYAPGRAAFMRSRAASTLPHRRTSRRGNLSAPRPRKSYRYGVPGLRPPAARRGGPDVREYLRAARGGLAGDPPARRACLSALLWRPAQQRRVRAERVRLDCLRARLNILAVYSEHLRGGGKVRQLALAAAPRVRSA